MTNKSEKPAWGFIDNPHAPDVFADAVAGMFLLNGNLRITFESVRVEHSAAPGPVNRVVIGRLILPLAAAENLRDFLTDYLSGLKKQQVAAQVQGPTTIQ